VTRVRPPARPKIDPCVDQLGPDLTHAVREPWDREYADQILFARETLGIRIG
jgi:hypothetical protein